MQASLPDNVADTVKKYGMFKENDHIVLGLSGGADSVCLLYTLIRLGARVTAVHVNHGLRGAEADADESFATGLCESQGIPLEVYRYDITRKAKELKLTEEEAGRRARYGAFYETLRKHNADGIAVAHNADDNAETVILNLIRGTGVKGLCGIPPIRDRIIRPLINTYRMDIEKFLSENNYTFRTDSTNIETHYTRNKVRLELLPYIARKINPNVSEALNRAAGLLSEENEYMEAVASDCYEKCSTDGQGLLKIDMLKKYHPAIQRRVIRTALTAFAPYLKDISHTHINMVMELIAKGTGKTAELPGGVRAAVEYGHLRFYTEHRDDSVATGFSYELTPGETVYISQLGIYVHASLSGQKTDNIVMPHDAISKSFDHGAVKKSVCLRSKQTGDIIYIRSIGGNKRIKDYMIDEKIPRDKRGIIPLVSDGHDILWIADGKNITNDRYKPTEKTKDILTITIWPGEADL